MYNATKGLRRLFCGSTPSHPKQTPWCWLRHLRGSVLPRHLSGYRPSELLRPLGTVAATTFRVAGWHTSYSGSRSFLSTAAPRQHGDNRQLLHSFRIGAATAAAAAGVPDHLIQYLGRWTSSAYLRYIWTSLDSIAQVAQLFWGLESVLEEVPTVTFLQPLSGCSLTGGGTVSVVRLSLVVKGCASCLVDAGRTTTDSIPSDLCYASSRN